MADTVSLSNEAFNQAGTDASGTQMLTKDEVELIASKLNHAVNLPILNEAREQLVFSKLVMLIDRFLYNVLPNEIYELIRDASDGIQAHDLPNIEDNLVSLATEYLNIPFLSRSQEETVYRVVIGLIVRSMLKGNTLDTA